MKANFTHRQSAHCENGVISNLLRFHGLEFDEPMIFGIGSGLFFLTFLLLNSMEFLLHPIVYGQVIYLKDSQTALVLKLKERNSPLPKQQWMNLI